MANTESQDQTACETMVMFLETNSEGERRLVGSGVGNFFPPLKVSSSAEALLEQLVDLDSVSPGSKVGIIQMLGRGTEKQVTIYANVDESVSRDDYKVDLDEIETELTELRE